jgi:hypothetical protein
MEPETSFHYSTPEQSAIQREPSIEHLPDLIKPESGVEKGAEAYEQKAELNAIMNDVGLATTLPAPVVDDQLVKIAGNTATNVNPITANDDDLIEKEWVDRAKKIVSETRSDPYQQEKAVSQLQIDYIKKRYGRKLGVAE